VLRAVLPAASSAAAAAAAAEPLSPTLSHLQPTQSVFRAKSQAEIHRLLACIPDLRFNNTTDLRTNSGIMGILLDPPGLFRGQSLATTTKGGIVSYQVSALRLLRQSE
jgi:hypothetical protein